jgi:translation initiation factor eIF-2B subunit gamma
MNRFPRVRLRGNLLDAHAYIFSRWVLDYLADRPRFISISEDLLPALVKMQWKRQRVEREGIADYIASTTRHHDVIDEQIALSLSTTQLPVDTTRPIVRCRAYIVSGNHVVIGRANTIPAYCELNRHLTKATNTSVVRVHASAEIDSKTQIGPDSMIGESTRMEERCSVKRSIIGAHCQIGKQVKIVNSIIMDGVSIGDNVKLDGCVVCQQAKILERSNLKDTVIGAQVIVPAETTARNEQFRRDMTE